MTGVRIIDSFATLVSSWPSPNLSWYPELAIVLLHGLLSRCCWRVKGQLITGQTHGRVLSEKPGLQSFGSTCPSVAVSSVEIL